DGSTFKPSYLNVPGTKPLSALTIGQLMDIAVEKWKDREAIVSIYQGHRFTYSQVLDMADRLAASLMQMGMKHGDRLGIFGPNSSDWYISRLAAARGGFIAVQLDPAYQAPQLEFSINKVEIKVLISTEFYKSNNCYSLIQTVVPELKNCSQVGAELTCSKVPSLKRIIMMSDKPYRGTYRLNDVINSAHPELVKKIRDEQCLIQPDDGCAIQFSSGTTGTPKGALLSHHNLVNNGYEYGKGILLMNYKDSKIALSTQFCHTSASLGGIIASLWFGSTSVLPCPVFDGLKVLEGIIKEGCTHMLATPSLCVDMISKAKENGLKVTTLKCAAYGGAPCPQKLIMDFKETLNIEHLIPIYGMTEICFAFVARPEDSLQQRTTTVGHPIDHCEVKIVDKDGQMVPIGQPGELWIRGYNVMLEYWDDKEKTSQFISPDRWGKTGDQFVLLEDGTAKIVGRVKDMIIRIADNIFPAEMEEFFIQHPDILECQVFGVPDPKVGEEICAVLRLRDGVKLTEHDIKEYCKDKLPDYRIPRYICFIKDFPRSAIGKIQRSKVLEDVKKELGIK
ncbi:hypothetical protein L9F63_016030, partial [Diploptera punctata]